MSIACVLVAENKIELPGGLFGDKGLRVDYHYHLLVRERCFCLLFGGLFDGYQLLF